MLIIYENPIYIITLTNYRFRLVHAVKPHTDRVTALVMSPDHNLIVTLSADQMIFFFKVKIISNVDIARQYYK